MSHLSIYLKKTGTRQSAFAELLGISKGYMSELASGDKSPSRLLAVRIAEATGGAVSVSSWDHNSLHANAVRQRQGKPAEKAKPTPARHGAA